MVNNLRINANDSALHLDGLTLDRGGAGKLAFVLQYWSLWGKLPKAEDVIAGTLPSDLN